MNAPKPREEQPGPNVSNNLKLVINCMHPHTAHTNQTVNDLFGKVPPLSHKVKGRER